MAFTEEEIQAALDAQDRTAQDEALENFLQSLSAAARSLAVESVNFRDPNTLAGGVRFFLRMEYDETFIRSGIRGLLRPDPFTGKPKILMAALNVTGIWTPDASATFSGDAYAAAIAGAYLQSLLDVEGKPPSLWKGFFRKFLKKIRGKSKQPRPEGRSLIVTSDEVLHSDGLQRPLAVRQYDQGLRCFDLH